MPRLPPSAAIERIAGVFCDRGIKRGGVVVCDRSGVTTTSSFLFAPQFTAIAPGGEPRDVCGPEDSAAAAWQPGTEQISQPVHVYLLQIGMFHFDHIVLKTGAFETVRRWQ